MQDEATWMSGQTAEESAAKERYEYFTRPEPRENMSDIYLIDDHYLGRETKVREVRIGMTRNAADENRKVVTAYLEPFPHIRIDKAKDLQGWYQSKVNESKQSRPRPCLLPGSLVDTPMGPTPIEMLSRGDTVWGMDLVTGQVVETLVEGTATQVKNDYIELEMENGRTLRLTADHLVFTTNRGWVAAGDLTLEDDLCELSAGSMS